MWSGQGWAWSNWGDRGRGLGRGRRCGLGRGVFYLGSRHEARACFLWRGQSEEEPEGGSREDRLDNCTGLEINTSKERGS